MDRKFTLQFISCLAFMLLLLVACEEETPTQTEDILGRWELQIAERNGRPTESLSELYFEFYEGGKMRTNLTGTTEDLNYVIEGNVIEQRNGQFDVDYKIMNLADSLLILAASIREIPFKFTLKKKIIEE